MWWSIFFRSVYSCKRVPWCREIVAIDQGLKKKLTPWIDPIELAWSIGNGNPRMTIALLSNVSGETAANSTLQIDPFTNQRFYVVALKFCEWFEWIIPEDFMLGCAEQLKTVLKKDDVVQTRKSWRTLCKCPTVNVLRARRVNAQSDLENTRFTRSEKTHPKFLISM